MTASRSCAIRANPDDDTARLAFADWLDERDDPRGEFVRVQIELEPIRYRIDNPRAVELHRREDELLSTHRDSWLGKVKKIGTNWPEFGPQFRRGLPNHTNLSLDTFLEHGEELFSACPTLREVSVFGLVNRCAELAACPHLAKLDTLEIADWPTKEDAEALAASPHIEKISHFKVWLGGDQWFLDELIRSATDSWPRDIEMVQLLADSESRADATACVTYSAEELGRSVVRVSRPCDALFPLNGDLGYNIRAGRLPDGRPALVACGFLNWVLVIFHEDGSVAEVVSRKSAVGVDDPGSYTGLESAAEKWMNEELGLKPNLIWVHEFHTPQWLSVVLWSNFEYVDPRPEPSQHYIDAEEWLKRGGRLRSWLEQRNFVINWGNNFWADWRGDIHSS